MSLFTSRNFLPLFLTQFLGALNDNLFKNALIMLITFRVAEQLSVSPQILVTAAAGIFILPFFLFSATAGQLADKLDKARMTHVIKLAEIVFMTLAAIGFLWPSVTMLMIVLFCMGCHSTFFGPIKYAVLPQHLAAKDLLAANSYVEASTFLAILLGTIAGGLLVMQRSGEYLISVGTISVAVLGYVFSRFMPQAPGSAPDLNINWRFWRETMAILRQIRANKSVYGAVLVISWFWLAGATYLTQFPPFAKNFLHGDETVVTLLLTLFSVGIAAGSVLCNRLLKGEARLTYVPASAFGMTVFGVDLFLATYKSLPLNGGALMPVHEFLQLGASFRVMADLFLLSACGGMFTVPLYTLVQKKSDPGFVSRTIAGLNIMNSLFMVASSLVSIVLLKMGFTIPDIFLTVAVLNIPVALYCVKLKSGSKGIF